MLRRSLTALLAIGLAATAAGCTTFSDNDAVARVGDVELTEDAFQAQLTELGVAESDVLNADAVRTEITRWIQEQLAALPVDEEAVGTAYDAGLATGNALCLNAIVVEDEAAATAAADELRGGAAFADVFAEQNIDAQLDGAGGSLPCLTAGDIEAAGEEPFLEAAAPLNAEDRVATAPLLDQQGAEVAWVTLWFRTFDELGAEEVTIVAGANVDADVFVDPRYGTFDGATSQVVPLG